MVALSVFWRGRTRLEIKWFADKIRSAHRRPERGSGDRSTIRVKGHSLRVLHIHIAVDS